MYLCSIKPSKCWVLIIGEGEATFHNAVDLIFVRLYNTNCFSYVDINF